MKNFEDIVALLFFIVIWGGGTIMYILNIVQLFQHHYETVTTILKVLGIFIPPVGVIAAFFG